MGLAQGRGCHGTGECHMDGIGQGVPLGWHGVGQCHRAAMGHLPWVLHQEPTQGSVLNAWVLWQEPVLFGTTILENIRFGKPGASDAEVYAAAQLANADGFIRSFPDGYQTVVGTCQAVRCSVGTVQVGGHWAPPKWPHGTDR